jgi:hypothetical protein
MWCQKKLLSFDVVSEFSATGLFRYPNGNFFYPCGELELGVFLMEGEAGEVQLFPHPHHELNTHLSSLPLIITIQIWKQLSINSLI